VSIRSRFVALFLLMLSALFLLTLFISGGMFKQLVTIEVEGPGGTLYPGEPFLIEARIKAPFPLNLGVDGVTVRLQYPNGDISEFPMNRDGGKYYVSITPPIAGSYLIDVIAKIYGSTVNKSIHLSRVGLSQFERENFLRSGGNISFLDADDNWKYVYFLEKEKALQVSRLWERNGSLLKVLAQSILDEARVYSKSDYYSGLPVTPKIITPWGWEADFFEYRKLLLKNLTFGLSDLETYNSIYRAIKLINYLNISSLSRSTIDGIASLIIYSERFSDFADLFNNVTMFNKFLLFIEKHPDCMNLRYGYNPYERLCGINDVYFLSNPLAWYDYKRIAAQNAEVLWFNIVANYDEETIEKYYLFFKAAVDMYKAYFMTTTSKLVPIDKLLEGSVEEIIKTRTNYFYLEKDEFTELKRLLDLLIKWNEKGELAINLISLEPIERLSIHPNSTYLYLVTILTPGDILTSYYYNLDQLKDFNMRYGGELHPEWGMPYDLNVFPWELYAYEGTNNTGFTRYMFLKYWIDEFDFRHRLMWWATQNQSIIALVSDHIQWFEQYYNLTDWDKNILIAMYISNIIHPDTGCGWIKSQGQMDLKSIGYATGHAYYRSSVLPSHTSLALWVSKYFILSQNKYGGALNLYNFIPLGPIGIEPFNRRDAQQSRWDKIYISAFSESSLVFERED